MSRPEMIRHLLAHVAPAIQTAPDVWATDYHLSGDFPGFTGHFPGNPVLPALLQTAMVRLLIEDILGTPCFLGVRNAKFSLPIRPDAVVTVQVTRGTGSWKAILFVRQAGSDRSETAATLSVIPVPCEEEGRVS